MNDTSLPAKMISVQAFEAISMKSVEDQVNKWIAENPKALILDISFQKGQDSSAIIVHRPFERSTDQATGPIS